MQREIAKDTGVESGREEEKINDTIKKEALLRFYLFENFFFYELY